MTARGTGQNAKADNLRSSTLLVLCALALQSCITTPPQATTLSSTEQFSRIRDIFSGQCDTSSTAESLQRQIRCTHDNYRKEAGGNAALRLFDNIGIRVQEYAATHSETASDARLDLSDLLLRVQEALESGDTVDDPVDRIVQHATVLRAREAPASASTTSKKPETEAIPLRWQDGGYVVAAQINQRITLDFILDSGASDVAIPADVARTLRRTGTLTEQDILGEQSYQLADGSRARSQRVMIRTLKVGSIELQDVEASIGPSAGPLLLGQSFLRRFRSWTIDNSQPALIVGKRAPD